VLFLTRKGCYSQFPEFFAHEVIQALYTFRLLDTVMHTSAAYRITSFALFRSYFDFRVIHEPVNGNPGVCVIRKVAIEICQWRHDRHLDELTIKDCVHKLCATKEVTQSSRSRWKEAFCRLDDYTQHEYDKLLLGAAFCTNTLPYIQQPTITRRQMLFDSSGVTGTCLFGDYAELAAKYSNEAILEHLLISAVPATSRRLRTQLLEIAAKAGRIKTVQFIYNFRKEEMPWQFDNKLSPEANVIDNIMSRVYKPDVWKLIEGLRRTHLKSAVAIDLLHTKLRTCARMGYLDMASHLPSVGAHAEGGSNPFSADHHNGSIESASMRGHVAVVELLLDNGAHPDIAIAPAASRGHFLLLRKLLERGITPKSAVTGVLGDLRHFELARLLSNMEAGPYLDVVRLLLDAGLDLNESTGKNSPLAGAVSAEHTALFEFLLEREADLHSTGTAEVCVRRAKKDSLDSMLLLLKAHGVDVDRVCDTLSQA
jgi:hypothetical protein